MKNSFFSDKSFTHALFPKRKIQTETADRDTHVYLMINSLIIIIIIESLFVPQRGNSQRESVQLTKAATGGTIQLLQPPREQGIDLFNFIVYHKCVENIFMLCP